MGRAPKKTEPEEENLDRVLDAWKQGVAVQMHFNDMEMKVRNLYFTIFAAALALIGVVQGKKLTLSYPDVTISLPLFVVVALIPITMLFYFIDRHWYHRLLMGAVLHCAAIEKKYETKLPEIQLGAKISEQSPVSFPSCIWKLVFFFVRDKKFRNGSKLHSDQKIQVMYMSVIWGCILIFFVFGGLTGIEVRQCKLIPYFFSLSCKPESLAPASTSSRLVDDHGSSLLL